MLPFHRHQLLIVRKELFLAFSVHAFHKTTCSRGKNAVYSRGSGVFGSLGLGSLRDSRLFTKVELYSVNPLSISSGWGHSSIGSENGLIVWGRPFDFISLLRINRLHRSFFPFLGTIASEITSWFGDTGGLYKDPKFISEGNILCVSNSAGLSLYLTAEGEVFSFGLNRWGQCGLGHDTLHIYVPTRVELPPIVAIDTGLQHCIALSQDGAVYTWGKGERGQLGDGKNENSSHPIRLSFPSPSRVKQISAGFSHGAVLLEDGSVYVWGKGFSLTPKSSYTGVVRCYEDQLLPRPVQLTEGRKAMKIQSSNFGLVILAEDGTLWALGMGEHDRDMNCTPLPVYVYDPESSTRSSDLSFTTQTVRIGSDVEMRKGYKRVCLFTTERHAQPDSQSILNATPVQTGPSNQTNTSSPSPSHKIAHSAYEVVIHNDEASIQPLDLSDLPVNAKLLDVSVGWVHSLALIEDINTE